MIRRLVTALLIAAACVALAAPGVAAVTDTTTDKQLASEGVLVQSDFPAAWTTSARARTPDSVLDKAAAKITSCKPFVAFIRAQRDHPRVQSPNFDESHSNVTNSVSVYPSDAKAETTVADFSDRRVPECLQKLFNATYAKELRKDPTQAAVDSISTTIAELPDIRIGDQAVVYQGTVDIYMKDGSTQIVALGFAATRVDRAVSGYSWTSDVDISDVLQPAIVGSVARLQGAQSPS
jgi:hypothetical protein